MTKPPFQRTTPRLPSRLRAMLAAVALVAVAPRGVRPSFAQTTVPPETALAVIAGSLDTTREDASSLFAPPEPRRLRPCCAFGGAMKVKVLGIPLPCYRHKPLRGAADIGPHEYDPGLLQILPSPIDDELRAGCDERQFRRPAVQEMSTQSRNVRERLSLERYVTSWSANVRRIRG